MSRYDDSTIAALHEALDDEYRARAAYSAIIERFGPVRPFVNIVVSEDRHAAALEQLLHQAGAPIPADRWSGAITPPASLREAYALGVQAEIDNHAMYGRLRGMTSEPEVLRVFDNLASASQDNHLTAFQRHLDRADAGMDSGAGMGGGRGGGQGRRNDQGGMGRGGGGRTREADAQGTMNAGMGGSRQGGGRNAATDSVMTGSAGFGQGGGRGGGGGNRGGGGHGGHGWRGGA